MTNEVITHTVTPAEAMAELERMKASLHYSNDKKLWYCTIFQPVLTVGCGATATEAIADMLMWLCRYESGRLAAGPARPVLQAALNKIPAMVEELEAAGHGSIVR